MSPDTAAQLQHRHQRDLGGRHASCQEIIEELPAGLVVAGMPAALEQMRQDDVIGGMPCAPHVCNELHRLLKVVLVHEGLDEHRVSDDVGPSTTFALHLLAELQGLRQAFGLDQPLTTCVYITVPT